MDQFYLNSRPWVQITLLTKLYDIILTLHFLSKKKFNPQLACTSRMKYYNQVFLLCSTWITLRRQPRWLVLKMIKIEIKLLASECLPALESIPWNWIWLVPLIILWIVLQEKATLSYEIHAKSEGPHFPIHIKGRSSLRLRLKWTPDKRLKLLTSGLKVTRSSDWANRLSASERNLHFKRL